MHGALVAVRGPGAGAALRPRHVGSRETSVRVRRGGRQHLAERPALLRFGHADVVCKAP